MDLDVTGNILGANPIETDNYPPSHPIDQNSCIY